MVLQSVLNHAVDKLEALSSAVDRAEKSLKAGRHGAEPWNLFSGTSRSSRVARYNAFLGGPDRPCSSGPSDSANVGQEPWATVGPRCARAQRSQAAASFLGSPDPSTHSDLASQGDPHQGPNENGAPSLRGATSFKDIGNKMDDKMAIREEHEMTFEEMMKGLLGLAAIIMVTKLLMRFIMRLIAHLLMKLKGKKVKKAIEGEAQIKIRPPELLGAIPEKDNPFKRYQYRDVQWTDLGRKEWFQCPTMSTMDPRYGPFMQGHHPRLTFNKPIHHVRVHLEDMTYPGELHWDAEYDYPHESIEVLPTDKAVGGSMPNFHSMCVEGGPPHLYDLEVITDRTGVASEVPGVLEAGPAAAGNFVGGSFGSIVGGMSPVVADHIGVEAPFVGLA